MDIEQIVHDLTMACLTVAQLPAAAGGDVLIKETVKDYIEKSTTIREFLADKDQ